MLLGKQKAAMEENEKIKRINTLTKGKKVTADLMIKLSKYYILHGKNECFGDKVKYLGICVYRSDMKQILAVLKGLYGVISAFSKVKKL